MDQRPGNRPSQAEEATEHTRWNFAVIIAEAGAFGAGMAWVHPASVLPLFISALTPSATLVGLLVVLHRIGLLLPQLPMAAFLGHRPRRVPYLRWGVLLGRSPFLAFVVYLWARGVDNTHTVLAFLMVAWLFVHLGNGFVHIPWQDIIAKSIPSLLRGRFWGALLFTHAAAGFGIGFGVRWALGPTGPEFPRDYVILFTLAAACFTASTVGCLLVREPIRPVLARPDSLRRVLAAAGGMLRRQPEFRALAVIGLAGNGIISTMPFYMLYATTQLGIRQEMAGVYISAATLGHAVFSLVWGQLNDRRGPLAVLRAGCVLALLTPLSALLLPVTVGHSAAVIPVPAGALPYLFAVVFVLGRSAMAALFMGSTNCLWELASHEERPRYIGIFNAIRAPAAVLPLLVGLLLNSLAYPLVFALIALAGSVAVYTSLRMPDPRRIRSRPVSSDSANGDST